MVWPKMPTELLAKNKAVIHEAAEHSDLIRVRLLQLEHETSQLKQDVKESTCRENSSTNLIPSLR